MKNVKGVLCVILGVVFCVAIIFSGMPLKATANELVPVVQFVGAPKTEYFTGDRVEFNINAANYGGKVEYRVALWTDSTKAYSDLWNASNGYPGRYYTKWQPTGNTNFTLGWPINEPGSYRITVYVKRVGIQSEKAAMKGMNCDSFVSSAAFVVKTKDTSMNEEGKLYGSSEEEKPEILIGDKKITAKNITLSNAKIDGNLEITGNNAVLKNIQVSGKITINVGKDGVSAFDKVEAKAIEILSAGRLGISIKNVRVDNFDVNSSSPTKIIVDGETEILATTANGNVVFDKKNGSLGEVKISKGTSGEPVIEFIGEITNKVIVNNASTIKAKDKSVVESLILNTMLASEMVKLEGNYKLVEIKRPGKLDVKAYAKVERLEAKSFADVYVATTALISMIDKGNNNVDVYLDGKKGGTTSTTKLKTMGIRDVKVLSKTSIAVDMERLDGITFIFDGVTVAPEKISTYDGQRYILTVNEMTSGYNYSITILKAGYNVYTKTNVVWVD